MSGAPEGKRIRADLLLVAQGLAESRAKAQALIGGGHVMAGSRLIDKPALMLEAGTALSLTGRIEGWVSRGAAKLLAALDHFSLPVFGVGLDIGASTGGFTQVLLARGAEKVYAIDVGHGQLHTRLAGDPRVILREGVNARALSAADVPEKADMVVIDVSFISLDHILVPAMNRAREGATLIALVKPQFEVGRDRIGKGGVVRDPAARAWAVERIADEVAQQRGWRYLGAMESPIPGGDGNIEYLLAAIHDA